MFKIIHISDLHIHGGASQINQQHQHSIAHMKEIEKIIKENEQDTDLVIISGDISNYGDSNSLLLGRQWIYNSLEIGNSETTSIGLSKENLHKIRIIPGNHDAWNSVTRTGKTLDRRQKSLDNFNNAFPEHKFDSNINCYFDWVEKDDHSLFLVFLDSSYLGDTELENKMPNFNLVDKVAKGKISKKQSEQVLEFFDKGMKGNLEFNEKLIPVNKFKRSLKILIMHHYLFEPKGFKSEPLLKLDDRKIVFANLVLADFDILLCGHKHLSALDKFQYGNYIDKRAKYRYFFNYFRRLIGTYSLPIQLKAKNGNKISKWFTLLLELSKKIGKSENENIDNFSFSENLIEKLIDTFDKILKNPGEFDSILKEYFKECDPNALNDNVINNDEIQDLKKRMNINLSKEQCQSLRRFSKKMKKSISTLGSREFIQIMAGSACKASYNNEQDRSFNIYHIETANRGYKIHCDKYFWENDSNKFSEFPNRSTEEFNMKNRPKF